MSTAREFAKLLGRIEQRLTALEQGARTSQLQNASITGTAITVYDEDGQTRRGSIGIQPDGTIGFVAEGGPAPTAPTAPTVTPSIAGLRVTWDGQFADGSAAPADFAQAAVHVSTVDGFTPTAGTFAGTITRAGDGGMLPVAPLPYVQHFVRLVGVNTSGVAGDPSEQASGTPVKVDGPDLTAGSVTAGAIAAGAVEADKLEAILTLTNRIVAGDSDGARVELNESGLRVYNGAGALVVQFDAATGDAVFSGEVNGAEITGSTVTGGIVQTSSSGKRVVVTPNGGFDDTIPAARFYSGKSNEQRPGEIAATLDPDFVGPYLSLTAPSVSTDWMRATTMRLHSGTFDPSEVPQWVISTPFVGNDSKVSISGSAPTAAMTGTGAGIEFDIEDTDGSWGDFTVRSTGFECIPDSGHILDYTNGVLTVPSERFGRVIITPAGDGVVTSMGVTGLGLPGTTFYGFATARTTVPGDRKPAGANGVTGVGVAGETSDGMTVYVNRQNTIDTIVNWWIKGE